MRNISSDFLISQQPDQRFETSIHLSANIYISIGKNVPFRELRNINGERSILIGHAVVASDSGEPKRIGEIVKPDILAHSQNWAGRWLLISPKMIIPDGVASLSCFYPINKNGVIGASHPSLACPTSKLIDEAAVATGAVIPPGTGYEGVKKLLPTQIMLITDGRIKKRPVNFNTDCKLTYEQLLESLAAKYQSIIRGIAAEANELWLPLTAGLDSRLLLAIAASSNIEFQAFTFQKGYLNMPIADRVTPPKLSRIVKINHKKIYGKAANKDIVDEMTLHFGRLSEDPGTPLYFAKHGYYDSFNSRATLLSGLFGELGRAYFHRKISTNNISADDIATTAVRTVPNYQAAQELVDWWHTYPLSGVDPIERAHWEARLSGKTCNALNLSDYMFQNKISGIFPAFNCLDVFCDLFSFEREIRIGGQHMLDLVKMLCPEILTLPINSKGNVIERRFRALLRKFV
ncbi:hypothetical protein AB2B41_12055 [Marimonas sp. MJW-29]|uniref:Asparagine synthetase domain-containing protein n=1 Tax=Sulfitobacter sediminis TaxID=3234186 RepID=A0ABV3RP45_9RHOB